MQKTIEFINEKITKKPTIGLVLGSGLGSMAEEINGVRIPYKDIPDFPTSTIEGHVGQLVIGELAGKTVVAMQGRCHFYEGYSMQHVTFPVRVMKKLGVENLILTNAAGGINTALDAGDLVLINDHINFMGQNPLVGPNDNDFGVRFPDMTNTYNKELRQIAKKEAEKLGISLKNGVYVACSGPSYETPAEIKMFRMLGGDVVGMSTVPEAIVGNHAGMRILGISCVTNMAAGVLDQPLSHEEVIDTSKKIKKNFEDLIRNIIKSI